MSDPTASVVIGFKDWGLDRLARCIDSVRHSFGGVSAEVIVSDYGSSDGPSVAETTRSAGAAYVRTDTDGTWSRSRALNAGFAAASGTQFFATDADMIFTPGALESVSRRLTENPGEAIILQCRDLPVGIGTEPQAQVDWSVCEASATIRPRWGMGGLVATQRETFLQLGGYDERMHTYGGEDIDYAKRLRRHGIPINWFDQPGVRMFHVWHPSSRIAASLDAQAEAAIAENRRIHTEDHTVVRNVAGSASLDDQRAPVVSVLARADTATSRELATVLAQTVPLIELLVIGPERETRALVEDLSDARVRAIHAEDTWWRAVRSARGTYVLLHAAGTWHPVDRVERLLDGATQRHVAPADHSVAALDSDSSMLALPRARNSAQLTPWASALVRTDAAAAMVQTLGPDVVDPNDLMFALARHGITFELQDGPLRVELLGGSPEEEVAQAGAQQSAHRLMHRLEVRELQTAWLTTQPSRDKVDAALAQTQRLMRDRHDVTVWSSDSSLLDSCLELLDPKMTRRSWICDEAEEPLFGLIHALDVPAILARRIRALTSESQPQDAARFVSGIDDGALSSWNALPALVDEYSRTYAQEPDDACWIVVTTTEAAQAATALDQVKRLPRVTAALQRCIVDDDSRIHVALALVDQPHQGLHHLLEVRNNLPFGSTAELWLGSSHANASLPTLIEVDA